MAEYLPKEVATLNPSKYHQRYFYSGYLDETFLRKQMKTVSCNIRRMVSNFMCRFPQLEGYTLQGMLRLQAALCPIIQALRNNFILSKEWIIILMHIAVSKMDKETKDFWKTCSDNTYNMDNFMDFVVGSIQNLKAIVDLNKNLSF